MPSVDFEFRRLAGVAPGVTTRGMILERLGEPPEEWLTEPNRCIDGFPGGDLAWNYPGQGLWFLFDRADLEDDDPVVDEVRVSAPFSTPLDCGLRVGQPIAEARGLIVEHFGIEDEYEDAVYFVPCASGGLLASVENWDTDHVVSIELMRVRRGPASRPCVGVVDA